MKKTMGLAVAIAIILGLSGCQGLTYPSIYHDINKQPEYKVIRNPKLNEVTTVEIGENIYSKSYLFYDNTYQVTLLEPAIGKAFGIWIDTTKSEDTTKGILKKWSKIGQDNINTMCISNSVVCITDINNDGSFSHFGSGAQVGSDKLTKPAKYKLTSSLPTIKENSFKYVVLYQGKKSNSIKISFREFKDNMARPAFTQDIEYELKKDGTSIIGFKGLRIEVLKATNMDITYKVIQDYN